METYIVGGTIRDTLIGIPSSDIDYCVVGSTEAEILEAGYKKVGLDFPVFLHPVTGDEYALARRERSTGSSTMDFVCDVQDVTLEEDLSRRDLTINAMAQMPDGSIYDPFNGQADIAAKKLRHVSEAFAEDPVRVLRLARLRAKLGYEWQIAYETKALSYKMYDILTHLQPDRVYKEVEKAMLLPNTSIFFETLFELGVLEAIFPHIYQLTTLKEGNPHHMEPSVFEHTMMMLRLAAHNTPTMKAAIIYHDIVKPYMYRRHGSGRGHDSGKLAAERMDIQLPANMKKKVLFLVDNHVRVYKTHEMTPKKIASFLEKFGRDHQLLKASIQLAHYDDQGRTTLTEQKTIQGKELRAAHLCILDYSPAKWINSQPTRPSGDSIKQHIHNYNIKVVKEIFKRN